MSVGSRGADEALPHPAGREARVVPDDVDAVLLGLPDPLPSRLRDPLEGGVLVDALERQRDPMARRLDLLDRPEAGGPDLCSVAALGGDLRVAGHDVDAARRKVLGDGHEARGSG